MRRTLALAAQRGFTLVEAVMVIVIIGILGAIVAVFIRAPIQGYVDAVARAEATDEADLALRRMARDIRLALPNSVRVNAAGSAIEFLLTRTGGRYLAAEDEAQSGTPLSFTDTGAAGRSFTVVGRLAANIERGNMIAVFNLGLPGADAYENPSPTMSVVAGGAAAGAENALITLERNRFADQPVPMPSPDARFQVVEGPVSYVCEAAPGGGFMLRRYAGYAINAAMTVPPAGVQPAMLAARVATCANLFRNETAASSRAGLVVMSLSLRTRNIADPAVRLVHQVRVDNTP